jgi:phage terminase large subunit-like protein
MLSFPDASHDDLMDSLALVVNHSNLGGTSIFGGSYGGDDDEW